MQELASFALSQRFLNDDSHFSSSQFNSESLVKMNFNEEEIISLINVLQNKIKSSRQEVNLPLQRNLNVQKSEQNTNFNLNSQINVFPDYFQAYSKNNGIETQQQKKPKNLDRLLFGSNKHIEFSLSKEWLQKQQDNLQEDQENSQEDQSQTSEISDIVLESEQKFEDAKTPREDSVSSIDTDKETKRRVEKSSQVSKPARGGVVLDQEKLLFLFSENLCLKDEVKEIHHKLDILISSRENDKLIIETLKDHLVSINSLLQRKDDEYNRLLTQHETLLLERWHESQKSKQCQQQSIQSTQFDFTNSLIDSNESMPKAKIAQQVKSEKNKENIAKPGNTISTKQTKKSQSSQMSMQSILNEKSEDKVLFDEIRNFCFRKK